MAYYNTIAESNNFIVLDDYEKYSVLNEPSVVYQTEASLEYEFIQDLRNQGSFGRGGVSLYGYPGKVAVSGARMRSLGSRT